ARSPWRCGTSSIATNSFHDPHFVVLTRPFVQRCPSGKRARPLLNFWRWLTIAAAKPNWPQNSSTPCLALIENGWRVPVTRTTDLVQKLQVARRELQLEAAILKLDKFDLLILDDLAYVTKDQAETSVLFELISARYERRSLLITANQPFGEWNRVFPDPAMTLAAVDRLVHHATIFELNVESYRRRAAMEAKRSRGRPASFATIKNTPQIVAERQSNQQQPLASDNQADNLGDAAM